MKANRKPAQRPDPIVYDLLALPVLNKTAESIRAELREYLDYMAKAGRKPPQLTLKPEQYDTLLRAVNAKLDRVAPLCGGLNYRGLPIVARGRGGLAHAS